MSVHLRRLRIAGTGILGVVASVHELQHLLDVGRIVIVEIDGALNAFLCDLSATVDE